MPTRKYRCGQFVGAVQWARRDADLSLLLSIADSRQRRYRCRFRTKNFRHNARHHRLHTHLALLHPGRGTELGAQTVRSLESEEEHHALRYSNRHACLEGPGWHIKGHDRFYSRCFTPQDSGEGLVKLVGGGR